MDMTGPNAKHRGVRLADYTVLTEPEAWVQALSELDRTDAQIAQEVEISESEVRAARDRIDERIAEAKSTLSMLQIQKEE